MGTTPNFGRLFLNLRRIVEVKKNWQPFSRRCLIINSFGSQYASAIPPPCPYINVEMDFPKLPKENGKGKLKIWVCTFLDVEM